MTHCDIKKKLNVAYVLIDVDRFEMCRGIEGRPMSHECLFYFNLTNSMDCNDVSLVLMVKNQISQCILQKFDQSKDKWIELTNDYFALPLPERYRDFQIRSITTWVCACVFACPNYYIFILVFLVLCSEF